MSKVICIMGESGSGKTTSMRNLDPKSTYYIDADKKGLSWKGWRKQYNKENAETVLGNSIRNAIEKKFPWIVVRKAKKASIIDRIRCTVRLMGAGRFWITEDCKSLQTALSDAVWNKDVKDKDERLDDGSTDIDSLDAFEYTIERDMRDLIEEVENV